MSRVRMAGVVAGYGEAAVLDGVALDMPEGSLTTVLGASGCGKSTLLRALAGLLPVRSGTIEIGGRQVSGPGRHVPPERRSVGLVPQDAALFPHRDVAGNIAFGLRRDPARRERVAELVRLVGLTGLERRLPHELSGGQRHRVALARALAPRPAVLLLDEPFAALDAGLRGDLRAQVRDVLAAAGTTALLVTHDQTEALSMGDQVAVLAAGAIAQVGSPAEVYRRPATAAVATLVGDAVFLPGRWDGPRVRTALGSLAVDAGAPGPDGERAAVLVRPEQVRVRPTGEGPRGALVGSPAPLAVVRAVDYYGHDADLEVDLLGGVAALSGAVGVVGGVGAADAPPVAPVAGRLRARVHSGWLPRRGDLVRLEVSGAVVVLPP